MRRCPNAFLVGSALMGCEIKSFMIDFYAKNSALHASTKRRFYQTFSYSCLSVDLGLINKTAETNSGDFPALGANN